MNIFRKPHINWVMEDSRKYMNSKGLRAMVDFHVAGKPVRIFLWEKRSMIPADNANACFSFRESEDDEERLVYCWWGEMHFNMENFGSRSFAHEVSHLQEHIRLAGEHNEEEIATAVGNFHEEFWKWFDENFEYVKEAGV